MFRLKTELDCIRTLCGSVGTQFRNAYIHSIHSDNGLRNLKNILLSVHLNFGLAELKIKIFLYPANS